MVRIIIDFETQSAVDLKKAGAYEYAADPSTRVLCLSFKVAGSKNCYLFDFATMQKTWDKLAPAFKTAWFNWRNQDHFVFVAHNAFFEQCIYNQILVRRLGWPALMVEKWRCSAAKAAAAAIPRNLADAGAVMRTSVQKDYEGHRVMLKLCKPTAAWAKWNKKPIGPEPDKFWLPETAADEFKKLYHYCKIDVLAEERLDASLPDLTPSEQSLWFLDQKINLRGVAVDSPLVDKISGIMAAESKTMTKKLDMLTMGLVGSGNARKAILDFLTLEGLELPDLRAKTVDDFLENGKATGDAEKILKIRRALAKSSTAKYKGFQLRAKSGGRVRDLLLFLGASRTGRWSGKGLQPQNFPRGVIKDIYEAIDRINTCEVDDLKLLYGENLMPLFSSVLRGMFIASKGYELFVEDYSAIECRVLWWLAGHEAGLKMFREGRDPYIELGAKLFNKSILKVTADERQVAKAATLGCGYQMGGKKFVTSAWDVYRAKVTKELGKIAVGVYREVHYPVTEMWEAYQEAAIGAVESPGQWFRVGRVKFGRMNRFLFIELPSGRRLAYADPKIVWDKTKVLELNNETFYASNSAMLESLLKEGAKVTGAFDSKRLTYFEVNQKAKKEDCVIPKWALERTYGGKLVENVVQAVSRDLLGAAMLRVENEGFRVLFHSHDELVAEAPKGRYKSEDFRKIMEVLPPWAEGLPLKSGGWTGPRYQKK